MANDRAAIVARARSVIGARFRPQGRSAEHGLDCVGVVLLAVGIAPDRVSDDYRLNGGDVNELHAGFDACGFSPLGADEAGAGDVLVARIAPGQLHAVVLTPGAFVHAHAGLRRVVETPGSAPWTILSAWRFDVARG